MSINIREYALKLFHDREVVKNFVMTYYKFLKPSHSNKLVEDVQQLSFPRTKDEASTYIDTPILIDNLKKGFIDLDNFRHAKTGNIYDFIDQQWRQIAKNMTSITVGSNGGMANVGKGEWLLSLGSGINPETQTPRVGIIKNGHGDLLFEDSGKTEEVKWNGGKVSVERPGNEISRLFNSMISEYDRNLTENKWVPFRKRDHKDEKKNLEIKQKTPYYNAKYWESISGEKNDSLSNNELMEKIIYMAYKEVFEKCDTFIMFNDDGKFQRFDNIVQATDYYKDKYHLLTGSKKGFECRASQSNPIALYCYVF